MHKLDPSRLNVLDRIKGRHLGAARDGTESQNEANRARNAAQAELTRLQEQARMRPGLDLTPQIRAAEAELEAAEKRLADARVTNEIAHERYNAAGNLVSNVRRWAEGKGIR
ncbi:hypothetical protein [Mesorhizobium australicum]|uniref:hypothetical protein n=1 Tax=Mesorhizobium australicum TaxID=536018 RepID=UPI003338E789